ncbi:hypothetical protein HY639_04110 [Candidatus Woesearchaeota archaeon]|nr:hypothetical protein [Candidatus Woesearchaeota archaeon]
MPAKYTYPDVHYLLDVEALSEEDSLFMERLRTGLKVHPQIKVYQDFSLEKQLAIFFGFYAHSSPKEYEGLYNVSLTWGNFTLYDEKLGAHSSGGWFVKGNLVVPKALDGLVLRVGAPHDSPIRIFPQKGSQHFGNPPADLGAIRCK